MQILYINRQMGLSASQCLALLYFCIALLTLLACSSIIATCRKHKPRLERKRGGEGRRGKRVARQVK